MAPCYSDAILDTVEAFLDTNPDIPDDLELSYSARQVGETETSRILVATIGGVDYLIKARRIGD